MEENYYRVRPKCKPDVYGIVVKVDSGKLECMTGGETNLKEHGCSLDGGNLIVSDEYFLTEIDKEEADSLVKDHNNWSLLQAWVGVDPFSTYESVAQNSPGTPENYDRGIRNRSI